MKLFLDTKYKKNPAFSGLERLKFKDNYKIEVYPEGCIYHDLSENTQSKEASPLIDIHDSVCNLFSNDILTPQEPDYLESTYENNNFDKFFRCLDILSEPKTSYLKTSKTGRWSKEEHQKFIEAILLYNNNWNQIHDYIKTRSNTQARSHSQKFFVRLQKNDDVNIGGYEKSIQGIYDLGQTMNELQKLRLIDYLVHLEYEEISSMPKNTRKNKNKRKDDRLKSKESTSTCSFETKRKRRKSLRSYESESRSESDIVSIVKNPVDLINFDIINIKNTSDLNAEYSKTDKIVNSKCSISDIEAEKSFSATENFHDKFNDAFNYESSISNTIKTAVDSDMRSSQCFSFTEKTETLLSLKRRLEVDTTTDCLNMDFSI